MKSVQRDRDDAQAAALAGEIRLLIGALNRRLREQTEPSDLTASQKSVLLRLERDGPATGTALARAEGMRPQSMGAILSALQAAGFVAGAPDPADGRQTILSLTGAFREWVEAGRAAREDWLFRSIRRQLTAAEQEQLATGIELLRRLLDQPASR